MEKKPKVSVIIPAYNRANYLPEAINSVLQQTFKDFEIVVVDDGSTDNTKEVLLAYKNKIKYIYQKNKKCAAARNTGFRNSNGDYLVFLDSDDLLEPRKLEVQVPILEQNPSVGFVYSDGFFFWEGSENRLTLNHAIEKRADGYEFSKLFFPYAPTYMAATLIRRKSIEKVGPFDENLNHHEDGDLLIRIAINWEVRYSDYPSVRVRRHTTRKSLNRIAVYRCMVDSSEKILNFNPDFRRYLGTVADAKMADLRYLLAHAYLDGGRLAEARDEFIFCIQSYKRVGYRMYLYALILSLSQAGVPDAVILRLLSSGLRMVKMVLMVIKNILFRKSFREITFVSGTTSWRECLIILSAFLRRENLVKGSHIKKFEGMFADYIGTKYAFSFGAARMALYAILQAMGIKEGDEVILPGYTCVTIPASVIHCGAKPIYVDINENTLNIDITKIENKINQNTKAIIAQHTFASFCNMDFINKLAYKYNLRVIEDCAHALGAEYNGKKAGTFGDAAFFTTEQTKIISTGMGGMAVTNDRELAERLQHIQSNADFFDRKTVKKMAFQIVFYNILAHPCTLFIGKYFIKILNKLHVLIQSTTKEEMDGKMPQKCPVRLSNIQARVGLIQLKNLAKNLEHRRKIAKIYREGLQKLGYKVNEAGDNKYKPAYIRYCFFVENKNKKKMQELFSQSYIDLGEWFNSPIHPKGSSMEAVLYEEGSCPVSEYISEHNVNLPTHLKVKEKDCHKMIEILSKTKGQV